MPAFAAQAQSRRGHTKRPSPGAQRSNALESGGLVSYGPAAEEQWRLVAGQIDKILKGAQPANLPVQQPTRFELSINLRTARALGLTIPQALLQRADHVIE